MKDTLEHRIIRHIQMSGPLPLAEYMHWCLFDRTHGYYTTQNVLGRSGDFITAPEISQMFGEIIGVWLIQTWKSLDRPCAFNLVELGPGNGTLMKDILRAAQVEPDFLAAAEIHMIESSENLADKQRRVLNTTDQIHWHKSMDSLPNKTSIFVANEFLDALPFRQYVKTGSGWFERCVVVNESGNLSWGIGAGKLEEANLPTSHNKEPEGAVFEVSTAREAMIESIGELITINQGAAIIIDYGHLQSGFGDTFQAINAHEFADPLKNPGTADLTSHIDFAPLIATAEELGCNVQPMLTQGEFLIKSGLLERAGILGSNKSPAEQTRITREAERLALPEQMGDLFKVFAFSSVPNLWPFAESS